MRTVDNNCLSRIDSASLRRPFSQTRLCSEWHLGSWHPTPSIPWRSLCAGKRKQMNKNNGGERRCVTRVLGCHTPPLLCGSFVWFGERREKNLNNMAFNIEKNQIFLLAVNFPFLCGQFRSTTDNKQFLKGIKNLVEKSGHKLKICYEYLNRGDRWMQVKAMRIFILQSIISCQQCLLLIYNQKYQFHYKTKGKKSASVLERDRRTCQKDNFISLSGWAGIWLYRLASSTVSCCLGFTSRWET